MAKKKATKKKVANTAPVSEQQAMIVALQDLQQHEGWNIVVNNFKANIAFIAECILDKVDRDGNEIDEIVVDQLRDKREFMKDLIKTPETFITQLQQSPENTVEDLDPYHTDPVEMQAAAAQEQAQAEADFLEVTKDP
jgi:hypothetical protein